MFSENRRTRPGLSVPGPVVRNSTGCFSGRVRRPGSRSSRARNSFSETGRGARPGRCSTIRPAPSISTTFRTGIGLCGPVQAGRTEPMVLPLGPNVICRTVPQSTPAGMAVPDQLTPWTFAPWRSTADGANAPLSARW
ncbi:hypothetical protein SCALM49S_08818 [Streptomyces californicus]